MELSKLALLMMVTVFSVSALGCSERLAEAPLNTDVTREAKVVSVIPTVTVQPTIQLTFSTIEKQCKLAGGENVKSGWAGKDTMDNSCNDCFCSIGALACTEMACPTHLPVPDDSKRLKEEKIIKALTQAGYSEGLPCSYYGRPSDHFVEEALELLGYRGSRVAIETNLKYNEYDVTECPVDVLADSVGREIFLGSGGCAACHTIDGISEGVVGPDLTHLGVDAASRKPGMSAEEYIFESIRNPEAFVAPDVNRAIPGIMTVGITELFSDNEVQALVDFLKGNASISSPTYIPSPVPTTRPTLVPPLTQ
jgi:hypothetical protein